MAQISLVDWIVAQAIANTIAEKLDSKIPLDASFAYRLNPDRYERTRSRFFKKWNYEWPEFRQRVRANVTAQLPCVAVTDIAGYYEHIDLQLLGKMLLDAEIPLQIVDLIFSQLERWTWQQQFSANRSRGLLQGNDISSLYANFYLYQLDEHFQNQGLTYHRYVDDMAIHVSDAVTAKRELADLARFLRKFGLSLNSGKTKILLGPDIEKHFHFTVGDQVEAHLRALRQHGEDPILRKQRRKLRSIVIPLRDATLTKRLITAYARARDPAFRTEAAALLERQPDWTPSLCRYFRSLDDETSVRLIVAFLGNPAANIYPLQEQQLIDCLLVFSVRSSALQETLKDLGWSLLRSASAHPYSRALAALLVYRYGDSTDAEELVDRYLDPARPEPHPLARRHLALAVSRLVDRENKTQRVISVLKGEANADLSDTGLFIEEIRQASKSRIQDVLSKLGLVVDQYDKPHKFRLYRIDTRDLILLNLCRAS
jgi:hypothetical protein